MGALSSIETYNVVTGGGVRGSSGKLSGTRFYYNDYYWGIVPQDTPEPFEQITLADCISGGYLSPNPYFVCDSSHPYLFNDKEITTVRYKLYAEPNTDPTSPDLYSWYGVVGEYYNSDGTLAGTTRTGASGIDMIGNTFNVCYGGWIDSGGNYNVGLVLCYERTYGDDVIIEANVEGFHNMPDTQTAIIGVWADGQKPTEDDGVTPTGGSGGGGGSYSRTDESIPIPSLPSISVCNTGFTRVYKVTDQNMRDFASFLWSNGFYENIIKNYQSPMDNIINLAIVPNVNIQSTFEQIYVGNLMTNIGGDKLLTTYANVNCGSINVNEYYNNFADYRTGLQIYLPYIGIRDVPIDDCMNGIIHVEYNVDVFTGNLVAFIQTQVGSGAWHVLASYDGNCASQIPLSGVNYVGVYSGLLQSFSGLVSGNPLTMASGLLNAKPSFMRGGSIKGVSGLLSIQYPYLIFTTPQLFTPKTFRQDCGYISNISGKLGTFTGYIEVDTSKLDLNGLSITEEERTALYDLLESGIYI